MFKVGDKVKCRLAGRGVFEIYQIIDKVAFLNIVNCIECFKLSDLEKVAEREAPPRFTKVYVWDGDKRPERPSVRYSFGELEDNRIKVCIEFADYGACNDSYLTYENWEVCV